MATKSVGKVNMNYKRKYIAFIFPILLLTIAFCLVAVSLGWYIGVPLDYGSTSVEITTMVNDGQDGTAAILTPISDNYEISDETYVVANTSSVTGYSGQTGISTYNYSDRAYIIFYQVSLMNNKPDMLEAYDYAYITKALITWTGNASKYENYRYGMKKDDVPEDDEEHPITGADDSLAQFQCIFLKKENLSNGIYNFTTSKSLIIDSTALVDGYGQVTFYIGVQFYNQNISGNFKFSDTKYMGSKFDLEIQFAKSSDMAFYYVSMYDTVNGNEDAGYYRTSFDTTTGCADDKYRLTKVALNAEELANNTGGTDNLGDILSVYELAAPLYLEEGQMLKVYNTLSTEMVESYSNADYYLYQYCYDYTVADGKVTYNKKNKGYPIRENGYYNIRLRVYSDGYKIMIEFPEDVIEFYVKGGYNNWGSDEWQKMGDEYVAYDYLYAKVGTALYRVTTAYANSAGSTKSATININNPSFYIRSKDNSTTTITYSAVAAGTVTATTYQTYYIDDPSSPTHYSLASSYDPDITYYEKVESVNHNYQYSAVTKLYNYLGEEINALNPVYSADGSAYSTISLTEGDVTAYTFFKKVNLYDGSLSGDFSLTFNYLDSVRFDSQNYYVELVEEDGVQVKYNKIYYYADGQYKQLTELFFRQPKYIQASDNTYIIDPDHSTFDSNFTYDTKMISMVQVKVAGSSQGYFNEGSVLDTKTLDRKKETESQLLVKTDSGYVLCNSLFYYDSASSGFKEVVGGNYRLHLKMTATETVGVDALFEFLSFNCFEQYFKYIDPDTGISSNFMVEAGVYRLTLDYDCYSRTGALTYERLYTYNEATVYNWWMRGSFDASWGCLDDYQFQPTDTQGLYVLQDINITAGTEWKISNANWSPSFNIVTCEQDAPGELTHFGKSGDGYGDFNVTTQIGGVYTLYFNLGSQSIQAIYQGAYVTDTSESTYWYLYNNTTTISDIYNFKRKGGFNYIYNIDSIWLNAGDNYRFYYAKDKVYYANDWFNNATANASWSSYFKMVNVDGTIYGQVVQSGWYQFRMEYDSSSDSYSLTYSYLDAHVYAADFYIKGGMNSWSNNELYQFKRYEDSNYYFLTCTINLPATDAEGNTLTSYEYKIANSTWSLQTTNVYMYRLNDGKTQMTTTDIIEQLKSQETASDLTFDNIGTTYSIADDTETCFYTDNNGVMAYGGRYTFILRYDRYVADGAYKYRYYVYAIYLGPVE